ncbi:MAG: response regulator [bacterium]|jgi:CheY-like chemotaxis protein|nr:response regulator [bacterium]
MSTYTILLADDEELVANVAKAMLMHLGYRVITAGNGKEALDLFQQNQEDISMVILDYNMPEMDGLDCLNAIRETSTIPALISTGASSEFTPEKIQECQLQGVLMKPFTMEEIRDKINKILS